METELKVLAQCVMLREPYWEKNMQTHGNKYIDKNI